MLRYNTKHNPVVNIHKRLNSFNNCCNVDLNAIVCTHSIGSCNYVIFTFQMELFPFRQNFEKQRNRQKYHHSLKEHPKFTKIAKFGGKML